uniref:Protein kinase domain-containing protein n=1 Tax=Nippostrongylus brasiliensis TaxID=27835 RepID=A0A0N4YI45_NIPBR
MKLRQSPVLLSQLPSPSLGHHRASPPRNRSTTPTQQRCRCLRDSLNCVFSWKIIKLLGSGAFGDVYRVIKEDDADKKEYAMKTEMADGNKQDLRLKLEVHVLTLCLNIENPQRKKHFLELFDRGKTKQFKFLVMTLVGPTLDDIRRNVLGRNYSRSTAMQLSHQTLESLADLHELGYLHRDIKPQNFAIGLAHCEKTVFILDFGVARKYTVGNTKEIKCVSSTSQCLRLLMETPTTPRVRVRFVGSVRFASRACHRYQEQGRKDDMESWLYLVGLKFISISVRKGDDVFDMIDSVDGIPWKRFPDRQVLHMKDKLFSDKLPNCYRIVPKEFKRIVQYIDCMMFKEKPDYTYDKQYNFELSALSPTFILYLRHSLNSIAKEHRIDTKKELDWVEKGKKKDNSGVRIFSVF